MISNAGIVSNVNLKFTYANNELSLFTPYGLVFLDGYLTTIILSFWEILTICFEKLLCKKRLCRESAQQCITEIEIIPLTPEAADGLCIYCCLPDHNLTGQPAWINSLTTELIFVLHLLLPRWKEWPMQIQRALANTCLSALEDICSFNKLEQYFLKWAWTTQTLFWEKNTWKGELSSFSVPV